MAQPDERFGVRRRERRRLVASQPLGQDPEPEPDREERQGHQEEEEPVRLDLEEELGTPLDGEDEECAAGHRQRRSAPAAIVCEQEGGDEGKHPREGVVLCQDLGAGERSPRRRRHRGEAVPERAPRHRFPQRSDVRRVGARRLIGVGEVRRGHGSPPGRPVRFPRATLILFSC